MSQPSKRVRELVDRRDDYSCVRCGVSLYSTSGSRHHRKLRSQGGENTVQNLILLCGSGTTGCHGWVHANPREARKNGWIVSGYADPLKVPVIFPDGVTYWLTEDGSRDDIPF